MYARAALLASRVNFCPHRRKGKTMPQFLTAADGTRLAYDDQGSGLPLLCLPGLTRTMGDFDYLRPHLPPPNSGKLRLIRMDYRGRGASGWSGAASYTVPQEGADALALLLERGGFPEPCLANSATDADRWRAQYATDLIREDVLLFTRARGAHAAALVHHAARAGGLADQGVGAGAVASGVTLNRRALPRHPGGAVHRLSRHALAP
jgi:pimeloyl-ACP methyl ester carboxylesterase